MIDDPTELRGRYVLPETTALVVIGGLDLLYTVFLVATHQAREANPLFSWLLNNVGPTGFVVFKALMLALPLAVAEFARGKHPAFVRQALRVCLVLYLSIYIFSFVRYNLAPAGPPPTAPTSNGDLV